MVEGPIENVTREKIAIALKVMKSGKAAELSKVCAEMTSASGEVGVSVMVKLCQRMLHGKGMPDEWQASVLVQIFREKGDVRNCNTYRGLKLLEHAIRLLRECWREGFEN